MRNSQVRTFVLAAASAALLGVGGCGGGDKPEDVVTDFYAAIGESDYGTVCDLLSDGAAQVTIDEEGAESCEEAVEALLTRAGEQEALGQVDVGAATVEGETATVEVSRDGQTDTVNVIQEDSEWKVDDQ